MLVLHLLATLIMLCLAWDVHRGTKEIIAMADRVRAKTDVLLQRLPPST